MEYGPSAVFGCNFRSSNFPTLKMSLPASPTNLIIGNPVNPWTDIQDYGAVPKPYSFAQHVTQVVVTGGSPNVTLSNISDPFFVQNLKNGQGVCLWMAGNPTQQVTPVAPIVTCPVTSGTQTLRYACVGYDNQGGLTATSPIASISGASIGPCRVPIQSASRDTNGVLTIVTAQPHGFKTQPNPIALVNPALVSVENVMPYNMNGMFMLDTNAATYPIPNPTTLICQAGNSVEGVPQAGIVGSTSEVVVWGFTVVSCPPLSGTTIGYYIYSDSPNPGGPLVLIGKCLYGECHFTDWGPDLAAGYQAPGYVPLAPPSVPQNQMFISTVISGEGTTEIALTSAPPTSGSFTILFDDGPNLMAAAQAAYNNTGCVLISAPRTDMTGMHPGYFFNSPITLPEFINIEFSCHCVINETITSTAVNDLNSTFGSPTSMQNAQFGQRAYVDIAGIGNPMFCIGEDQGNSGSVNTSKLGFTCSSNGQTAVLVRSALYTKFKDVAFSAPTNFGTSVGLVYSGSCTFAELENTCWNFTNKFYSVGGTGAWGPPIPAIWLRCSDNPNMPNNYVPTSGFIMKGTHTFLGRGILFDHTNSTQPISNNIKIGDLLWIQANTTPTIMFWGRIFGGIDIYGVQNDTSQEAVIANWSTLSTSDVVVRNCRTSLQPLTTGAPIIDLTVSASSDWRNWS